MTVEWLFAGLKAAAGAVKSGKSVLSALAEQGISSPIVLFETGSYRSRRIIDWIKNELFGGRPDSVVTAFGPELNSNPAADSISSALTSYSLLSPLQLVAILESDKIKVAYAPKIAAAVRRGAEVSLAIIAATDGDKAALVKELAGAGIRVAIPELTGAALARWIGGEAAKIAADGSGAKTGPAVTSEAAEQLARLFPGELSALSHEIEKLSLLADRGAPIDAALVRKVTVREIEHNSFELFHRITRRDAAGAAQLVELLIAQGFHPLQIAAFLGKAIRTAIAAKDRSAGGGAEKLNNDIANPWFARNLGSAIAGMKPETLRSFLTVIKKLDSDLKGSKLPPELVTSLAAVKLAATP